MNEPVEIIKGLWTIDIELPANPLRNLNTYVVKAPEGGRNLIIDTDHRHGLLPSRVS